MLRDIFMLATRRAEIGPAINFITEISCTTLATSREKATKKFEERDSPPAPKSMRAGED
jgi:hypothetical protein